MAYDRFMIAPLNTGLQRDVRSWLIMDDSFEKLQNAYLFRGRVRKRFGSIWMGTTQFQTRLRIQVGTIGSPTSPVPGNQFNIGQMFSAGTQVFTVITAGVTQPMLSTGPGTGTFSTTDGAFALAGTGLPGGTPIFWYPALPVMGITQYEIGAINNHPTYAFDTEFAYRFFPGTGWDRSGTGSSPIWHGNDLNFFWAANWMGAASNIVAMFVTNFNATVGVPGGNDDPIWVTQDGAAWTNFSDVTVFLTTGAQVSTARIILPFKNRLILLNTIELNAAGNLNTQYKNRCRYSHNGSPFSTNAWLEPNQTFMGTNADGAGFVDATTEEGIVSAEFIKDRLIVYFERSTWELVYTANETLPFVWQKINTELGSQGTFSTVPFDKLVLTIGNTGIHACTGANVERIDNKIPDEIFEFKVENNENLRIAGIRDYITEMVYWTFVDDSATETQTFPTQVLVYNYRTGSWAVNDDCFTAFGYFEQLQDTTWASTAPLTWSQANFTWDSGIIQANQRQVLAGTPEGFVVIIQSDEVSRNAPSMQITSMTIPSPSGLGSVDIEAINHNVAIGDYVTVENAQGITQASTVYLVTNVIDEDNFTIFALDIAGIYTGGGVSARVSVIQILTKRFNPYVKEDRSFYLAKVDFAVLKTANGEITVDYYPSSTELSMIQAGIGNDSIMGNNVLETSPYALYPLENEQSLLWHPVYFQTVGEFVQLYLYFTSDQMVDADISLNSEFELEAMTLYTTRTSARLE